MSSFPERTSRGLGWTLWPPQIHAKSLACRRKSGKWLNRATTKKNNDFNAKRKMMEDWLRWRYKQEDTKTVVPQWGYFFCFVTSPRPKSKMTAINKERLGDLGLWRKRRRAGKVRHIGRMLMQAFCWAQSNQLKSCDGFLNENSSPTHVDSPRLPALQSSGVVRLEFQGMRKMHVSLVKWLPGWEKLDRCWNILKYLVVSKSCYFVGILPVYFWHFF